MLCETALQQYKPFIPENKRKRLKRSEDMYREITNHKKEIVEEDPSLPQSRVIEVSMQMFAQGHGASPLMSPGVNAKVTMPERRSKL